MTMATPSTPNSDAEPLERLHHLVQRAEKGDERVVPELRAALDANPWVWQRYGHLGEQAMAAWLQLICGPNLLLRESLERKAEELNAELAGQEPSPLEKLLVERVVACWLQCHYADCTYAQATGPQVTLAARQELMKRQESAQRRYFASIKQLALVRKLLRPAVSPLRLAMDSVPEAPVDRRGRATVRADGQAGVN